MLLPLKVILKDKFVGLFLLAKRCVSHLKTHQSQINNSLRIHNIPKIGLVGGHRKNLTTLS